MRAVLLLILLLLVSPLAAQDALISYVWDAAGLVLDYPADWAEPLTETDADGQPVLVLSQTGSFAPDDAIITLALAVIAPGDSLPNRLISALAAEGIDTLEPPTESLLLNSPAIQISGTSADGAIFGLGLVMRFDDSRLLLMTGAAPAADRTDFELLFADTAASLTRRGEPAEAPVESDYGILWNTYRSLDDGDDAWLELIGLAAGPDNTLYTIERDLGLIRLDATTGAVLDITPYEDLLEPSAVGVDANGNVYVADVGCGCIHLHGRDGAWSTFGEFGIDAPRSLTVSADGAVLATDIDESDQVRVRIFRAGTLETSVTFSADQFLQPVLGLTAEGQAVALTQYGSLVAVTPGTPLLFAINPVSDLVNGLALTADNRLVLATGDQGVVILDAEGQIIAQPGEIVPAYPLPGELVQPDGVVIGADGTLYVADSDGTFGAVTAFSTAVAPDRMGAVELAPGVPVQGLLDESTRQQTWTYAGQTGERITLSAIDNSGFDQLNVALRVVGPDGAEVAFNDDQAGDDLFSLSDAQIVDLLLPTTGEYLVIVEAVEGTGAYSLGLSQTQTLELDSAAPNRESGSLGEVLPVDRWAFTGSAGQTLTITLEATSGTLDPLLRVFSPAGDLLAENDDADDPALGTSAQISALALPENGEYIIEAVRFDGTGSYELIIVVTSP